MKRADAQKLIGDRVKAWTSMNGEYVGILQSIHGSPFRGVVTITGILKPASHLQHGAACRRGFRVGESIEVGHSSLSPCDPDLEVTVSYLEAVQRELAYAGQMKARGLGSRDAWVWPALEKALMQVAADERRRLAGEPWRLDV